MTNNNNKYLIVNADDFGYCPERNRGIIDAFNNKAISSSTLLVNSLFANDAAKLANEYNLPLGLHFNITEGESISPSSKVITLLDENTRLFRGKFGLRDAFDSNLIDIEHIRVELEAQIKRFIEITGKIPTHVDGHQHIHVHKKVCEIFAKTLKESNIDFTRIPYEELTDDVPAVKVQFYQTVLSDCIKSLPIFKQLNLRYPTSFVGLTTMGSSMTFENIKKGLEIAFTKSNVVELMVHPGYQSKNGIGGCDKINGPDQFSLSNERFHELTQLCSTQLKTYYNTNNIKLINFNDLKSIQF